MNALKISSLNHCLSSRPGATGLPLVWRGIFVMEEEEVWKPIKDWEDYYHISNYGRLKSLTRVYSTRNVVKKEKIVTAKTIGKRYLKYTLYLDGVTKTHSAHRLVAEHFIPNIESKPYINHINGIKTDNRVENLEWCTPSENIYHAYKIGLSRQDGENHATKKLNWASVREIRKLHSDGVDKYELAKTYNIHHGHVNNIIAKLYWKE